MLVGSQNPKISGMAGYTWSSNLNEKIEGNTKPKDGDHTDNLRMKAESMHSLPIPIKQNIDSGPEPKTNENMRTVDTSQIIPVVDIV